MKRRGREGSRAMNRLGLIATAMLTLSATGLMGGCTSGSPPATGTFTPVVGELKDTLGSSLDRAWEASRAVVKELQFEERSEAKDAFTGRLTARQADGEDVVIRLTRVHDDVTDITIKVGLFGAETRSREIMSRIKSRLKK